MLLHEFAHPVFAHPDAPGQQFLVHAWPAVFPLHLGVDGALVRQQGSVAVTPGSSTVARLTPTQPVEVPLALTSSTPQDTLKRRFKVTTDTPHAQGEGGLRMHDDVLQNINPLCLKILRR